MKQIDFEINVETTGVEASIQRFQQLRTEIKGVSADSEEFRKLKTEMDDIQDSLKAAGVGAGNFVDILGEVPGPIGDIGSSASRTINTLKGLSSIKFSDIKKSIGDLKDDFVAIARNIGNLTGITKVYAVTNAALAKSFVAIGIGERAAAAGAKAFSTALISTGVGALVVGIGYAVDALINLGKSFMNVAEENKEFIEAYQKNINTWGQISRDAFELDRKITEEALTNLEEYKRKLEDIAIPVWKEQLEEAKGAYEELKVELDEATKAQRDYAVNAENASRSERKRRKEDTEKYVELLAQTQEAFKEYQFTYNRLKADELKVKEISDKEREREAKDREAQYEKEKRDIETRFNFLINQRKLEGQTFADLEIDQAEALIAIEKKYGKDSYALTQALEDKKVEKKLARKTEFERIAKETAQALILTTEDQMNAEILAERLKYDKLIKENKENSEIILQLREARLIKEQEIRDTYRLEQEAKDEEAKQAELDRERAFIDEQLALNQTRIDDEVQDYEARLAVVADSEALIRKAAYDSEAQRTADLKALSDQRIQITLDEARRKAEIDMAYADLAAKTGQLLSDIAWFVANSKGEASKEYKRLAVAGVAIESAASIMGIISSTAIANAESVAAFPLTFGQPWVGINTASAVLSVAEVLAQAIKSATEINSVQVSSSSQGSLNISGGSSSSSTSIGSKFGTGGLLTGNLHGAGGIMTPMGELEGGEFVINRASTRSFLPLLERINSMGAGQTIPQGNVSSSYENRSMNSSPIIKTYVVASEMTSEQEKQKRIKNLAKL